jgi:hypothetical protein
MKKFTLILILLLSMQVVVTAQAPRAYCRFVPERADDFAWENDKVAFRVYGPALKSSIEDSGVDCWFKRVEYSIIDKWYALNAKGISYHEDHGEGCDPYKVGASRGCGGLALWIDGKMVSSDVFNSWRILKNESEEVVFVLDYKWEYQGDAYEEEKQISLKKGDRLFCSSSIFRRNGELAKDLAIVVGLVKQGSLAQVSKDLSRGRLSLWEPIGDSEMGTAIVMNPNRIDVAMTTESENKIKDHALLVALTDDMGRLDYYAGYGWKKAGEIASSDEWIGYLNTFIESQNNFKE